MELDTMISAFWMLSFKPAFSPSSFTLIQRLFSSSSLSATRVASSAYLRLLYFSWQSWFQLVLHPAQRFSWWTVHISKISRWQYIALTYFFPDFQSVLPWLVLTAVSAHRFLRRQVRWSGIPISLNVFQCVVIHTVFHMGYNNLHSHILTNNCYTLSLR